MNEHVTPPVPHAPSRLACLAALCLLAGIRPHAAATDARVEDMSWGPIHMTVTVSPRRVSLDRDIVLTLQVTAPTEIDVALPILNNSLRGFTLNGAFADAAEQLGGDTVRTLHARLSPLIADEYQLDPMAIIYTDTSRSPSHSGWFATRPLVFEVSPPEQVDPGAALTVTLSPTRIWPSRSRVVLLFVAPIAALLVAAGLIKAGARLRPRLKSRALSSSQHALKEIDELVRRDLVGQRRVKDFYAGLSMIVRRYIENRHAIRAPEQTTREFIASIHGDPRFPKQVVERLDAFLSAADLVKFATHHPKAVAITRAIDTARRYIRRDAHDSRTDGEGGRHV